MKNNEEHLSMLQHEIQGQGKTDFTFLSLQVLKHIWSCARFKKKILF